MLQTQQNEGRPAPGNALMHDCPQCHAALGAFCVDADGQRVPFHLERARVARWVEADLAIIREVWDA